MASYQGAHRTAAGTNLPILVLEPSATVPGKIHQLVIGSAATPADVATRYEMVRTTVVATGGTLVAEKPVDTGTGAAACNLRGGTMTGPTFEADFLLEIPLNQRATFTWIANPGRELRTGLTTANGIGLQSITASTPETSCTFSWDE